MAASGITRPRLPTAHPVICTPNDPATPELAAAIANTRPAAAAALRRDPPAGSIAVLLTSPTTLFPLPALSDPA